MFKIDYNIISVSFNETEVLTEEKIQYDFFLGDVGFISQKETIEMKWGWIPLLDFSFRLFQISQTFRDKDTFQIPFEFTESDDLIIFFKEKENVHITTSFTSIILNILFNDFDKAVRNFHSEISKCVRKNIPSNIKGTSILEKYLIY